MRAAKVKAGCYQGGSSQNGYCGGGRVHRATGGRVGAGDSDMAAEGGTSKPRLDRAPRAGKDKSGKGTTVNVIVAGKGGDSAPAGAGLGAMAAPPPPMPQRPPMMPPAGGPPPGMLPRARGGRVTKHDDAAQDKAMINKAISDFAKKDEAKDHKMINAAIAKEDKREHRANGGWIKGAIKHKGSFKAKAEKAGESTAEFAKEKASAPGVLGKQARLAETLGKLRRADGGRVPHMTAGAESGVGRLEKIGKKP